MPTAIAGSVAAEGTLAYFITYVAATVAITYTAKQLTAKSIKRPDFGKATASDRVTTKSPAAARRLIYGEQRVGGNIVYVKTAAPIAIGAPGEVVFHYQVLPTTGPLTIRVDRASEWQNTISVRADFGNDDNVYLDFVLQEVTGAPGPGQYSVIQGVYTFNAAQYGATIKIRYNAVYGAAPGVSTQVIHLVIVLASHECQGIDAVYFNEDIVPLDGSGNCVEGKYANRAYVKKYLGTASQAADPDLISGTSGQWTTAHRLQGHAYLYVRLLGGQDVFPTGLPNITAVVRGKNDIYDPRDLSTGYKTNAVLCIANYLTDTKYGWGADFANDIHGATCNAEATVADDPITLAAGGSEPRYALNAVIDTSETLEANLAKMLSACGGKAVWSSGKWYILTARYQSPTVTLDESDARGPLTVTPSISRRDIFNAVKGIYISSENHWQPSDYPAITSSAFEAEDSGERIYRDLDLPCTTSGATAQRLAKIALLRHRQGLTVTYPARLSAAQLMIGDTVQITNTRLGWSSKTFEVIDWQFATYDDDTGSPALGIDLTLWEIASAVFEWTTDDESSVDITPNTSLVSPFIVPAVTGLTLASGEDHAVIGADGQITSRMLVSWHTTTAAYMLRGRIEVDANVDAIPNFRRVIDIGANARSAYWSPIAVGTYYEIRARWVNDLGVAGPWSAPVSHTAQPINMSPSDVTGFFVDGVRLTWTAVADAALAGYRIRYHQGINRSWGNAIAMHTGLIPGSPWDMSVQPTGQVTFMIKAVDRLGNESVNVASIVTDLGDVILENLIFTKDFDALGYPGTLTGGVRSGGNLNADTLGYMWDTNADSAMWNTDGALMWQSSYQTMVYEDSVAISSAEADAAMTLHLVAAGDSLTIEYRPEGPNVMWSEVADDLMWATDSATFMWNLPAYQPWPGSVTTQADIYDFRVTTGFGVTAGQISEFSVNVDVADIIEHLNDVSIASGGTRLTLAETYRVIRNVQLTIQTSAGSAVTAKALDKDIALGPLVQCFTSGGSGTTGTVDVTIQGY